MDDLISRQAAIDVLMEILDRPNHAEFLYTDEICRALSVLPSTQPEQTEWMEKEVMYVSEAETPIEAWQSMRCSKCGRYYTAPYMYYIDEPMYCPMCGAKTRERREGDEN